jgi:hypothetical protein
MILERGGRSVVVGLTLAALLGSGTLGLAQAPPPGPSQSPPAPPPGCEMKVSSASISVFFGKFIVIGM